MDPQIDYTLDYNKNRTSYSYVTVMTFYFERKIQFVNLSTWGNVPYSEMSKLPM